MSKSLKIHIVSICQHILPMGTFSIGSVLFAYKTMTAKIQIPYSNISASIDLYAVKYGSDWFTSHLVFWVEFYYSDIFFFLNTEENATHTGECHGPKKFAKSKKNHKKLALFIVHFYHSLLIDLQQTSGHSVFCQKTQRKKRISKQRYVLNHPYADKANFPLFAQLWFLLLLCILA